MPNQPQKSQSLRELEEALGRANATIEEGRRAIGGHWAPNDCYATGPLTGDSFRDLVECPACSFISMYDAYKARTVAQSIEQELKS